jgi:hypothetical protein
MRVVFICGSIARLANIHRFPNKIILLALKKNKIPQAAEKNNISQYHFAKSHCGLSVD